MNKTWFVVHTKPMGEEKALANLRQQGFDAYLPRIEKRIRHARRTRDVQRPLFPRYLFVSFDEGAAPWRAILSTFGVADLIRRGENPIKVPDGIVESIFEHEQAGTYNRAVAERFSPGQSVRFKEGAFADLTGKFLKMMDGDRVLVLLDLMKRPIRTKVSIDVLMPA